jgi:hypothetical protein
METENASVTCTKILVDEIKHVTKDLDDCRQDGLVVATEDACEPEWEPPANESWDSWDDWDGWDEYVQQNWPIASWQPHILPPPMMFWPPMPAMMQNLDAMMGNVNPFEQPYQILCPSADLAMRALVAADPSVVPLQNFHQLPGRYAKAPVKQAQTKSKNQGKQEKIVSAAKGKKPCDDRTHRTAQGGDVAVHGDLDRPPGNFAETTETLLTETADNDTTSAESGNLVETEEKASKSSERDELVEAAGKGEESSIRYCTHCGGRMRMIFKFCGFCGAGAPTWES